MSVADTDSWVNINTVLKHALRNNVSVWIDYMVLRFPYKMRQEYSERHKTYQTFIRESFVPEFLLRLHGNNRDFSDKYLLSLGIVKDACEKVAKQYPDVVVGAAGGVSWAILDEEKFIQASGLNRFPHVARILAQKTMRQRAFVDYHNVWYTASQLLKKYNVGRELQVLEMLSEFATKYPDAVAGSNNINDQRENPMRLKRQYAPKFKEFFGLHTMSDLKKVLLSDLQEKFPDEEPGTIVNMLAEFFRTRGYKKDIPDGIYKYQLMDFVDFARPRIAERKKAEQELAEKEKQYSSFMSAAQLLRHYIFDNDFDYMRVNKEIRAFENKMPVAVYCHKNGMCDLDTRFMDDFIAFTGWKIIKAPGQELVQPDADSQWGVDGVDKTLVPMSDDEIDKIIVDAMGAGVDGYNQGMADSVITTHMVSDKNLPIATDEWIAVYELTKYFEAAIPTIHACVQRLRFEMPDVIQKRLSGHTKVPAWFVRKDAIDLLAKKSGLYRRGQVPPKTPEWMNVQEIAAEIGGHEALVRTILKQFQKDMPDVVRDVKTKTVHVLAVHKSALGIVAIEVLRRMAARSKRQFERGGGRVRAAGKMQDAKKRKISTQHTI